MNEPGFHRIDIAAARQLLARGDVLLLDVRDARSYEAAHIESARHVSRETLDPLLLRAPKDKPVLIYCYHGNASQTYAQMFADFGFREAYSLDGGYEGWRVAASHYARIGGQPAVDRLVDTFYRRMDTLPEATIIRGLHPPDLADTKVVLKKYLAQWLGGPDLYSQQRGHPRLRQRHLAFRIGAAERDAWMLCMRGALDEIVPTEALRAELLQQLFKLADWMRNHDVQH
jgi:hemoglobin